MPLFLQQRKLTPAWGLLAIAVLYLVPSSSRSLRCWSFLLLSLSVKVAYSEKTDSCNDSPTPTKPSCNITLFYCLHIPSPCLKWFYVFACLVTCLLNKRVRGRGGGTSLAVQGLRPRLPRPGCRPTLCHGGVTRQNRRAGETQQTRTACILTYTTAHVPTTGRCPSDGHWKHWGSRERAETGPAWAVILPPEGRQAPRHQMAASTWKRAAGTLTGSARAGQKAGSGPPRPALPLIRPGDARGGPALGSS